jgi:CheY-like chemotaxis protein
MQGTILLVEDEAAIAAFVQTALEREGFAVEAVEDGQQALARMNQSLPALTWAGYPHAAYYKVYLAPWGGGEAVIQFEKTAETTYTVASPLQAGRYDWSIHAYNAQGTKLAEGSGHFTVAGD